jgi:hypothetical protein
MGSIGQTLAVLAVKSHTERWVLINNNQKKLLIDYSHDSDSSDYEEKISAQEAARK